MNSGLKPLTERGRWGKKCRLFFLKNNNLGLWRHHSVWDGGGEASRRTGRGMAVVRMLVSLVMLDSLSGAGRDAYGDESI